MSKIRVHELAARIGRQNREVIEALKEKGVEVKSHMSSLDEASVAYINQKFLHRGKEQITKVDNSRTEEKMVTAKPEAENAVETALKDLCWEKSEEYLDDEQCYEIIYEIEV